MMIPASSPFPRLRLAARKSRLLRAGVSVLAGLGMMRQAQAQVVHSGILHLSIPYDFAGLSVNIGTGETVRGHPAGWDSGPWFNLDHGGVHISNSALFRPVVLAGPAYGEQVVNLVKDSFVGSGAEFAEAENASITHFHEQGGPGQFRRGESGYMAFLFHFHSGGPVHYGWARLTIDNTPAAQGVLHEWAYEATASAPITIGTIPESSAAALMLLAGAALAARRRAG
jgi:hypothetical protein